MQVATAQLAGGEGNDDIWFTTNNAVIMLDGASAFLPLPVAAADYVDHLGRELQWLLSDDPDAELVATLASAISTTATRLQLTPGDSPSSTVAVTRARADAVDVLVLGDTQVVTPHTTVVDHRIDELDSPQRATYRERLRTGAGYGAQHRELVQRMQAAHAKRRNREGGYWIAEARPEAAQRAVTTQFAVVEVPWVVLVTDGAYVPLGHLGLADWPRIARCDNAALAQLLQRCHDWEARVDSDGRLLPRAKPHDDKTIAVVRFDR